MLKVDDRLAFGLWKERNPISTRVELGCLGLAGTLWLGTPSIFRGAILARLFNAASIHSSRGIRRLLRLGDG